jgi:hypothetical protein
LENPANPPKLTFLAQGVWDDSSTEDFTNKVDWRSEFPAIAEFSHNVLEVKTTGTTRVRAEANRGETVSVWTTVEILEPGD